MFGCNTHLLKHIKEAILAWSFRQNIILGCYPVFAAISARGEFIVGIDPTVSQREIGTLTQNTMNSLLAEIASKTGQQPRNIFCLNDQANIACFLCFKRCVLHPNIQFSNLLYIVYKE